MIPPLKILTYTPTLWLNLLKRVSVSLEGTSFTVSPISQSFSVAFTSRCRGTCSSPNSHRTRTASLSSVPSSYSFLWTPGSKHRAAPHLHFAHKKEGLQQPVGVEEESNPPPGVCCQDRKGRQGAACQTLAEVPGAQGAQNSDIKWGWAMPSTVALP